MRIMCRGLALLDRMDNHCRLILVFGIHQQEYADEYEWDTQKLAHIEQHILLESHLRLLDELYQETHAEKHYEEYPDKCASSDVFQLVAVHPQENQSENQIAQRLVYLRRMMRNGLPCPQENEAPRKRGDIPVYLRIEKIPETDEHPGETYRYAKMVKHPQEIEIIFPSVMAGKPPHRYNKRDCTSMAGQTALPRHENLPEAFPAAEIIVRLIEDAVSEPCAHYSADKQGIKQRVKQLHRHTFPLEEPLEDEPSEHEPCHEKNRIPPDRHRAYMENLRIDIPVYKKKIQHRVMYLHYLLPKPTAGKGTEFFHIMGMIPQRVLQMA